MEKVLFTALDLHGLGVLLEPDCNGHAAVVKSMVAPIHVEVIPLKEVRKHGRQLLEENGKAVLEVGDILYALNGKLLHFIPHQQVLERLRMDFLSHDNITMAVLSFLEPEEYYLRRKSGSLESRALQDKNLFGKIEHAGGWRQYLINWRLWDHAKDSPNDGTCGSAYLKFTAGKFGEALEIYNKVLLRDPLSHTVRLSRAMCLLRLNHPEASLKDAQRCIALKPEWPSAYFCKGAALEALERYLDACAAYVCGLTVDPFNQVLRRRLQRLMLHTGWSYVMLDGQQLVGSVAAAVMQGGGQWDLFVDKIVVYVDSKTCLEKLVQAPWFDFDEEGHDQTIQIANQEQYKANYDGGNLDLANGDSILSVNSNPLKCVRQLNELVMEQHDSVIIGFMSGSKIAASELLQIQISETAERVLSLDSGLITFSLAGAGHNQVNGVYVPQELKNGANVYENENGFLLSLEQSDTLVGWVIGKDGKIFYAALLGDPKLFHVAHSSKLRWRAREPDYNPIPKFGTFRELPPLGFFTGDEIIEDVGHINLTHWGACDYILAIKGFGNRSFEGQVLDAAESCYNLVQEQIQANLQVNGIDIENYQAGTTFAQDDRHFIVILVKVLLSKSTLYLEMEQPEKALASAKLAISLESSPHLESQYNVAVAELALGNTEGALVSCGLAKSNSGFPTSPAHVRKILSLEQELEKQLKNDKPHHQPYPYIKPKSKFSDQIKEALHRGVKADLLQNSVTGAYKAKFIHLSQDGDTLKCASKTQQLFHLKSGRVEIIRGNVKGILEGSISERESDHLTSVPDMKTCFLTIVTCKGSFIFRFGDASTRDRWCQYLASWINP